MTDRATTTTPATTTAVVATTTTHRTIFQMDGYDRDVRSHQIHTQPMGDPVTLLSQ